MGPKSNPRALGFRRRLAAWYRRAARDLPWRRTRDPWAIVVSEFMLQQTQVSRVLDYYPRFLERYPTAQHLAKARPAAVREAWDGLGYYRRAANLHALARTVVNDHDGRVPSDLAALRALPGVGAYTAGAVACFAYEQPVATVDTNVARVLARVFEGRAGAAKDARTLARLTRLALRVQPSRGRAAWTFNQAVMELGALVCAARHPRCDSCPVRSQCRWLARRRKAKGRTVG
jgi:A/G-specific adenine glycosylase